MSLQTMIQGYTDSASGLFEGVSPEDAAKYDILNGPITMAMEAAELFDAAFMEGFYKINELDVEAALEGYSSIMEAGKIEAFKEKIKGAAEKIAALFRNMGKAIHAFLSNIAAKIKERALASDKFFNELPNDVKVIKYKGPKFTHLDEVKDILSRCKPNEVLGSVKGYSKILSGDLKEGSDFSLEKFKEEAEDNLENLQTDFGVPEAQVGEGNVSLYIASYFRNNHAAGENDSLNTTEQEIDVSYVRRVVKAGAKISSDISNIGKAMRKEYDDYAKKCEELSKREDMASEFTSAWMALASVARKSQSIATTIISAWNSAYMQAVGLWESGARQYQKKSVKRETDGGYRKN